MRRNLNIFALVIPEVNNFLFVIINISIKATVCHCQFIILFIVSIDKNNYLDNKVLKNYTDVPSHEIKSDQTKSNQIQDNTQLNT